MFKKQYARISIHNHHILFSRITEGIHFRKAASKDVEIGFSRWVRRLIDHEKILLGLVNGPAMGMSATTLGLFDFVVCSDKVSFKTKVH